ncbi:MAG: helix-turn-helix domain-containing protein [Agriterribacter sp.]
MDNIKNTPVLFPLEPEQFLQMVRAVVKDELEKFASRQPGADYKVAGLTYKPLYKMDEVCEIFDITPPTIYDWIKHGKLKPKKVRSRVFFLWNDIQELLQEKGGASIKP